MKNLLLGLLFTLVGLVVYSCTQNEKEQIQAELTNIECGDWNEIGQLHNDGLEGYFLMLKESSIEVTNENKEEILLGLKQFVLDFYPTIQSGVNPPHYPISEELNLEILELVIENFQEIDNPSSEFIYEHILATGHDQILVDNVKGLFAIYDNPSFQGSYNDMASELDNYKAQLSAQQQWNNVLDDGYNVAKATFCYWKESSDKWNKTFAPNRVQTRDFIGNGRADISGAVIGACVGDGPGAVSGACYSTAASILWDIFGG